MRLRKQSSKSGPIVFKFECNVTAIEIYLVSPGLININLMMFKCMYGKSKSEKFYSCPHDFTMGEFASGITVQAEERRPSNNLDLPQASLFTDLWNGSTITLPTHSWALHRVEKTGIGPLVVINEMMANSHGIPFPLKQLVINSSGNMMALVLNQIIDVSLISSVMPLQSIEDLQDALKYFDQIDCEYVYMETV